MSANLTRQLGALEHLLWAIDPWAPRHFVLVARIDGMIVDRLYSAMGKAQRRHPALRVCVRGDASAPPRFVSTDEVIPLRVIKRVSDMHWQTEARAELEMPFQAEKGPLLRAVVVYGKPISEIILVAHHSIGDGLSAIYLVGDLLKIMDGNECPIFVHNPLWRNY